MILGLASSHIMPSLTCKHVSFSPLLQILVVAQYTLLVTCHEGMMYLRPSDEGSSLTCSKGNYRRMMVYRAAIENISS